MMIIVIHIQAEVFVLKKRFVVQEIVPYLLILERVVKIHILELNQLIYKEVMIEVIEE